MHSSLKYSIAILSNKQSYSTVVINVANKRPMLPSYRNQSIDLFFKSISWGLCDGNIGRQRVPVSWKCFPIHHEKIELIHVMIIIWHQKDTLVDIECLSVLFGWSSSYEFET